MGQPRVATSIDELLAGAVGRRPMLTADSKSGHDSNGSRSTGSRTS